MVRVAPFIIFAQILSSTDVVSFALWTNTVRRNKNIVPLSQARNLNQTLDEMSHSQCFAYSWATQCALSDEAVVDATLSAATSAQSKCRRRRRRQMIKCNIVWSVGSAEPPSVGAKCRREQKAQKATTTGVGPKLCKNWAAAVNNEAFHQKQEYYRAEERVARTANTLAPLVIFSSGCVTSRLISRNDNSDKVLRYYRKKLQSIDITHIKAQSSVGLWSVRVHVG